MKYSIVIVTFNRLNLLKECIHNALNQSIPPESVIIVDNASNDGTNEYLDELSKIEERIIVYHEEENLGGSGGFHDALKLFIEEDTDWVMIIDDDAILDLNCIEMLNQYIKRYNLKACSTSVITDNQYMTFHRRDLNDYQNISDYEKNIFYVDLASFCGLFVNKEVINSVGLPEKDYFIWYDDTEYCYRINKLTKIAVIPQAKLNHKTTLPQPSQGFKLGWKDYYGIRNSIHMLRKHKHYSYLRMRLKYIMILWLRCLKRGKSFKNERKMCFRGLIDGFRGKLGKNPLYLPGKPLGKYNGGKQNV